MVPLYLLIDSSDCRFWQKEGGSEEKEGEVGGAKTANESNESSSPEEKQKKPEEESSSSSAKPEEASAVALLKPKRVYEKQPLLIPFDLVHGNSVRVFCAICRREYLNRYLLKVSERRENSYFIGE